MGGAPVTLRLVGLALTVAAAAVLLGLGDGPRPGAASLVATAAGDMRLHSSRDGVAVLSADALAPGDSASGTVRLTNASGGPLDLSLAMTGLTDEAGEGGGVLSQHLDLRLERVTGAGADLVWSGALAALPDVDLGTLAAGDEATFRLTATLPEHGPAIDDRFARASVEVGYRWTGLGATAPPVEEEEVAPPLPVKPVEPVEDVRAPQVESYRAPEASLASPGVDEQDGPRSSRAAAVRLWLGARASQRVGSGLGLSAVCRPGCTLQATAQVRVGRRWRSLGRRGLGSLGAASQPASVRFALTRSQRGSLRAALRGRRSLPVRVTITAAAPGHDSVTKVRSLRLRP